MFLIIQEEDEEEGEKVSSEEELLVFWVHLTIKFVNLFAKMLNAIELISLTVIHSYTHSIFMWY